MFQPDRACKIILATVVLHNLCMEHNVSIPEDRVINGGQLCNNNIYNGHQTDGSVVRTQLIESISLNEQRFKFYFELTGK